MSSLLTEQNTPKFHEQRADRAEDALQAYKHSLGETGIADTETLRDFIQDALHWLARRNAEYVGSEHEPTVALMEAVELAVAGFPKELAEGVDC